MEVTTATEGSFCSIKCLDNQGCNSFAYLTYTSSENCLLSSSVDGASVSGASGVVEIYKKVEPELPKVSFHSSLWYHLFPNEITKFSRQALGPVDTRNWTNSIINFAYNGGASYHMFNNYAIVDGSLFMLSLGMPAESLSQWRDLHKHLWGAILPLCLSWTDDWT